MQTIITRLHYWELDCEDDLAEITLPDDVELMAFRYDLECELGAVPYDDDLLGGASDKLNSVVKKYGGSWHWLCFDWEIDVRWDEESEEEDDGGNYERRDLY